ncbi:MAG: penicillin-binding protein 2 [Candidatus Eremiobacteraeota bacterium]|nr:penicillin-binding protein 2 [Candidatus Eremiobacteraeota bacterium]
MIFVVSLFLIWRLYDLQVLRGPVLAREALMQRSDTVELFARRGSILDRSGSVLVRSLPSQSVYAVPSQFVDPDGTVRKLVAIFGKLNPAVVLALHDKHMQFVWIERKISHDTAERVRIANLEGIYFKQEDTGRRYDTVGHLASTVLGFVGIDENGLDGIEYTYDSLLKGSSGRMTLETDEFGRPIPFGQQTTLRTAKPGLDLALTLDSDLQYQTERALAEQVRKFSAQSGSAIIMDPNTGEVLALANIPDYEPNDFGKFSGEARRDRAVMDAYEPGSTFKLVTAAAALESGEVTTSSMFPARDTLQIGGRTIHNAEDGFLAGSGSSETLEQIIEYSHNVGAAEVGMRIGQHKLYEMIRNAGFGSETRIGLPGENPGILPALPEWSDSSLPTISFGQGISVTPLALARFYCAIANGGMLLRPRILSSISDGHGKIVYKYSTQVERRIFSQRTAATLRKFLRTVVLRGTGNPTAQIAGYTTAGKTGTAQLVENGQYAPGQYVASFVGLVPAEHPRYVILVKVTRPRGAIYGGVIAAPAFAKIATEAMLHAGVLPTATPSPKITGERLVKATRKTK